MIKVLEICFNITDSIKANIVILNISTYIYYTYTASVKISTAKPAFANPVLPAVFLELAPDLPAPTVSNTPHLSLYERILLLFPIL